MGIGDPHHLEEQRGRMGRGAGGVVPEPGVERGQIDGEEARAAGNIRGCDASSRMPPSPPGLSTASSSTPSRIIRPVMNRNQALLRHFLAALAYRTAKALRDAPVGYDAFEPGHQARTPRQLVRHMSGVINYAIGLLTAPRAGLTDCPTYGAEVERFFALLRELAEVIRATMDLGDTIAERLLQGPLADAMAHAGQLALLRRLSGSPIPPEDFFMAAIDPERLGREQADARSPDAEWPEAPEDWSRGLGNER